MLIFTVPEERKKSAFLKKKSSHADLSTCGLVKVTTAILLCVFCFVYNNYAVLSVIS